MMVFLIHALIGRSFSCLAAVTATATVYLAGDEELECRPARLTPVYQQLPQLLFLHRQKRAVDHGEKLQPTNNNTEDFCHTQDILQD